MPHNWNGDYIESKADKNTDVLGFGEIGGVGQLIYHNFRFAAYTTMSNEHDGFFACPVCDKENPPDLTPKDNLTGKEILTSLCELAREIDDVNGTADYRELILKWCMQNMHPYAIDYLYEALTDKNFDIGDIDAEYVARDAIFRFDDFMNDLGKLYNAARFYIALEAVCFADNESAYDMYREGRFFEGLPYFERYKHNTRIPDIDVSAAGGDLLKEMRIEREYLEAHPVEEPPEGEFFTEPYDEYEQLRSCLMECIPDFKLRLKVNPQNNRLVFSADVNSVFDIAWYVLARMMSEDPAPEDFGREDERPEGIMICCHHCGRFFIRNARHQQYCDRTECQKARNAKNQRDFRRRKAIQKAQAEKSRKKESEHHADA